MISMLKGQVAQFSGNQAVLMVGGVGYLVNVPAGTHLTHADNREVTLYTMLIVRQDCMDLYGFIDQRQREIFALLLGVSGIGPKTAMNIVSSVEPNRFLEEVVSENIAYLMGLPGIGNKGAQRIVLELKERIARHYKTIPAELRETWATMRFPPLSPWGILRTRPGSLWGRSRPIPWRSS